MGFATHKVLNTVLPMWVRTRLRGAALLVIPSMRHLDMPARLRHLAKLGMTPGVIYDVGAASGEWARLAHGIWPSARIHGFEPNASQREHLEHTARVVPGFSHTRCFLGSERRTVKYADKDTQTSLFFESDNASGTQEAPMLVLDEMIAAGEIPPPDLIKLDVQGFELEVLKGATNALQTAQCILMEVTFIPFMTGMPLVDDVLRFMHERGFAWYDITSMLRRPQDDALLQIDAVFVPQNHRLRTPL